MELDLGPGIAEFRAELRDWIAAQAPEGLADLADWRMAATGGGYQRRQLAEAAADPAYQEWEGKLQAARLICPQWPEEFGGQGLDALHLAVLNEEFHRAGVPRVHRGMGEAFVGPSVIVHGTPEQRGSFLPRIISGDDVYCQGFSEPGHGSDLAAVETRGPGPGVEYRPIRQMSGAAEFCEDFLEGVRAPLFNVIGGLGRGWRVAMTTLGYERGGQATTAHLGFEREFWELVETARKYGKTTDPMVRQQLASAYTGVQLMRFSGLATLARAAEGRPPGPEASVAKLFWSEYHKRLGEIAVAVVGSDALLRPEGPGYPTSRWQNVFLGSRAGTIYSGTSEIQRTIIGERALGLPKEPRVAG